jgi:hypothetical protein
MAPFVMIVSRMKIHTVTFQVLLDSCINKFSTFVYMRRQIFCNDYFLILLEFLEFMCNTLHHRACARDYARDDVIGVSSLFARRVAWLQYAVRLRALTTRNLVLCTSRHNQHNTL